MTQISGAGKGSGENCRNSWGSEVEILLICRSILEEHDVINGQIRHLSLGRHLPLVGDYKGLFNVELILILPMGIDVV